MIVTISKSFDFDAAHWLPLVADGHKCKRMHGHTYRVDLLARGEPNDHGMVCDYADLARVWEPIHGALDHRTLNEVPGLENPTTEGLAMWILDRFVMTLPRVAWRVRVWESATTWCDVERE